MKTRFILLAGALISATGCYVTTLRHQAAVDHDCSEDRTVVLSNGDSTRPWEIDVCGKVRRYRPVWLDVTDLAGGRPPTVRDDGTGGGTEKTPPAESR